MTVGRRKFLRSSGNALATAIGAGLANSLFGRTSSASIFAGLFLEPNRAVQVPSGYYDETTQLYFDATKRQPMFVELSQGPAKRLSGDDLQELIDNGWTRESPLSPKARMAQWCTASRETSYSTTSCCPIVTDTSSDTGCDDTGSDPPPR
jgi:hypothetical protein